MNQPNRWDATADYPPVSNDDRNKAQNGVDTNLATAPIDWLKLVALVVLAALILRVDYSALPHAFNAAAASVTGFFTNQPEEPALPLAPPNQIVVYSRPIVTVPNNVCSQQFNVQNEVVQHRSTSTESRSNCHQYFWSLN